MNRIKQLRKDKGMLQEELAQLLNVQRSAISKYETGKVPLTNDTLSKLSEIFDTSIDYILYKTDNPTSPNTKKIEPEAEEDDVDDIKWGDFGMSFSSGRHMNDLTDEQKDKMVELLKFAIRQEREQNKKKEKQSKVNEKGDGKE